MDESESETFIVENVDECLFLVKPSVIQRMEEPQQEVARLSYLALPIRRADLLFSMCCNKGQVEWLRQEAAVREKAGAAAICLSRFIVTVERSRVRRWRRRGRMLSLHKGMRHIHKHWSSVCVVSELVWSRKSALISQHRQVKYLVFFCTHTVRHLLVSQQWKAHCFLSGTHWCKGICRLCCVAACIFIIGFTCVQRN